MKRIVLLLSVLLFLACGESNPKYEVNLRTAQLFFALHEIEDLEGQLKLLSPEVEMQSPIYGAPSSNREMVVEMIKGYHDMFEDISWTPEVWLPGTDRKGNFDGSVRTYGTWTGTYVQSGKSKDLKTSHYFNFNNEGLIERGGDFFDFNGMMAAVLPKNLVFATLAIKDDKAPEVIDILNGPGGLSATKNWDGCLGAEMVYNPESNTVYVSTNWNSNDDYLQYRDWRLTKDTLVSTLIPHLKGGEKGLFVAHSNKGYKSF